MTVETTFRVADANTALSSIDDRSRDGKAVRDALQSFIVSGALGQGVVHAHAKTSERMIAVLVRLVQRPEDAR